jgi:predicted nucleic acid-binding protein
MLVVDTSAFISLAVGDVLETATSEFDIVTTNTVVDELAETAEYDDRHGTAARTALELVENMTIVDVSGDTFVTSRIDSGEASCVAAVRNVDAAFLITDDYRALPELRELVDADVALSPIVLRALVNRGAIHEEEANAAFELIAEGRDWLEAPIYRYARQLFE